MGQGTFSAKASAGPQLLSYNILQRLGIAAVVFFLVVGIGLLIPVIAARILGLAGDRGLPLKPVVALIASIDSVPEILANGVLWALIALVVIRAIQRESARIELSASEVRCQLDGELFVAERDEVGAVFLDGKLLTLLGRNSEQLFRGPTQASRARLAAAFTALNYPWRDQDPFADLFQPWSPAAGVLPDAADMLLSARGSALAKKQSASVAELTRSLQKLGVVVREEGKMQYWRPLVRS